jgi:hypothetical protein
MVVIIIIIIIAIIINEERINSVIEIRRFHGTWQDKLFIDTREFKEFWQVTSIYW